MSLIKDYVFEDRVSMIKAKMREQGIDLMLVYSDIWRANNVAYFTDYRSGAGGTGQAWCMLLLPASEPPSLLTGFEMTEDAAIQSRGVKQFYPSYDLESRLREYCEAHNPKKIGLIGNEIITHKVYTIIGRAIGGLETVNCDYMVSQERWVKTEDEILAIKKATKLNDKAIAAVIDAVKEGASELELYGIGASVITGNGGDLCFIPTVAAGTNSAIAMKRPSDKKVEPGDIVMLDFGANYEGYSSDTTRTIGYRLNDSYKRSIIETALEAREAALSRIKPGEKMRDIEATIRNIITKNGFGEYLLHDSGHGLGVDSSEEDLPIHLNSDVVIKQGMVFTVEPGIYIPNVGGCRIEEAIHVTQNGCEVFSELRPDYFID